MKRILITLTLSAMVVVFSCAAFAHHGQAGFDLEHLVTLKGTVTQFEFVNPHVLIHLAVPDANGNAVDWICSSAAPRMEARVGWTADEFKPGEELTVVGFADSSGRKFLAGVKHIRANGEELHESAMELNLYQAYLDRQAGKIKTQ